VQSEQHHRIDYIEIPVTRVDRAKNFYGTTFGWKFEDYGPEYASFVDGRLSGGLNQVARVDQGGPPVVIYSAKLEETKERVIRAGGKILRETFEFPGGRRFHFSDLDGNQLAVWSDKPPE